MNEINLQNQYLAPVREEKGLLCYYCSMETFFNIVSSNEFFMNDMLSMNDPLENYLLNINYSEDLKKLYKQDSFDFNYVDSNGNNINFNEYIETIDLNYEKHQNFKYNSFYFSLCFSKKIDDLPMWRTYGDNGKGVYIAIKKQSLKDYCDRFNKEKEYYFSENVIYKNDLNELREIFAKNLFEEIKKISLNSTTNLKDFNYIEWLKTECFKYKLGDFANEKEIRLVYKKDTTKCVCDEIDKTTLNEMSDIKIRYHKNNLIMYKDIPINSLEIDSICIGPQNNCDKATLNLFLAKNNLKCNKIYKSSILYR